MNTIYNQYYVNNIINIINSVDNSYSIDNNENYLDNRYSIISQIIAQNINFDDYNFIPFDSLNSIFHNGLNRIYDYRKRCLNCNRTNVDIIQGEHITDRICAICLESENVCYGCSECINNNLPSCCESCYSEIQTR